MFCGWGHRKGCVCVVCVSLQVKNPRFASSRKTIMKVNQEEKGIAEMLRKPKPGERTGPVEAVFNDADFKASYPHLTDHLVGTRYEDGSSRVTSTLLIFCDSSVLRVCLNDRDNNRSVFFTGETVEVALTAAENALAENSVEWRSRGQFNNPAMKTPF